MAAGIATLQAIAEPGFQTALDKQASRLDEGLRAASAAVGLDAAHARIASMVGMNLGAHASADSQGASGTSRYVRFHEAMLNRGVLLSPLADSCLFVSAGHTEDDIDRAIDSAHEAFKEMGYSAECGEIS
jgi:glutamate-1-semialdehyde 2,1-aminomutase